MSPQILNLSTRWRQVVGFTARPLCPHEIFSCNHTIGGFVGLRASLDAVAKRKNPCPFRKSDHGRPARSLATILTELSGS